MSCDEIEIESWPAKHPDATLDYAIDFEEQCARQWEKWQDYSVGQRIRIFRSGRSSGLEMECTVAGRSGGRFPIFPSSQGATVIDGSVTWTARTISATSLLRTIDGTPEWDGGSGITISGETVSDEKAIARIAGGEDGKSYEVTITATCSDGLVLTKTVQLPVSLGA